MTTTKSTRTRRTEPEEVAPEGVRLVLTQRSTNLERDTTESTLPSLYVGQRSQDALERLVGALEDQRRSRAWSLTGPYGSGKSTLALLIDAILCDNRHRHEQALGFVRTASDSLATRLEAALATDKHMGGFLGAVATARRESLVTTLTRALRVAVDRKWPKSRVPVRVQSSMAALEAPDSGSAELLDAVEALCSKQPVLLVIDEFGKTLEYLASRGDSSEANDDLFLLQELAELGAGPTGLPLYMFTLQHLSFLDYASRTSSVQSREWAKIQGRFEDITFTTHLGDALELIVRTLDHSDVSAEGSALIAEQAQAAYTLWPDRGLEGVVPGSPSLFADLYPLHPLTALVAPLLAEQIGQNDRSLAGFLSADEPNTVHRFLAKYGNSNAKTASTLRLPSLYDYFLASGRTTIMASPNASRWIEIDVRINEAHALSNDDKNVLKTVGLLNLVDSSGALRASEDMVIFALTDPASTLNDTKRRAIHKRLEALVKGGFLVYRSFSDEYRVWRGTDIDIQSRIDEITERCDDQSVLRLLANRIPAAVVAGRHSQITGMLRHFVTAVTATNSPAQQGPQTEDPADGLMLFHLGPDTTVPVINSPLPAVVGTSDQAAGVLAAGKYLLALQELLDDRALDSVARREVGERASQAASALAMVVTDAFAPAQPGTTWRLFQPTASMEALAPCDNALPGRSFAAVVSAACEQVYDKTPHVRNELLGRHQLTSQGAKARRELLIAMINHPGEEFLGIAGYGPERAMYGGVLAFLGLHGMLSEGATSDEELVSFGFTPPAAHDTLAPAWQALNDYLSKATRETSLSDAFQLLMAPPFGIKAGVVPLVVSSALILRADDIAIFEEGTYRPRLTDDLIERLVRAPFRFTVKASPTSKGQRQLVLREVSAALNASNASGTRTDRRRNVPLLTLANTLLDYARALTPYARQTHNLSPWAAGVRQALITSRDPDSLIFTALPRAVGLESVAPDAPRMEEEARIYVTRLTEALSELSGATERLRSDVISTVAQAFRLPAAVPAMRRELADRARGYGEADIEEPRIKGLVRHALNSAIPDEDWIDPLVILTAGTVLNNWTDKHVGTFPRQAQELARSLERISHLFDAQHLEEDAAFETVHTTTVRRRGKQTSRENSVLIHVPDRLQEPANALCDVVETMASDQLGPDGMRVLFAAIGERLAAAGEHETPAENVTADHGPKKVTS